VKGKQKSVTDGPFAEAKDGVDGYTLIEARDLDQAVELSMGCPIFELDGECHRNCATEGPERGIEELRAMADSERLTNYPFYHAAFGEFVLRSGKNATAREHFTAGPNRKGMERRSQSDYGASYNSPTSEPQFLSLSRLV